MIGLLNRWKKKKQNKKIQAKSLVKEEDLLSHSLTFYQKGDFVYCSYFDTRGNNLQDFGVIIDMDENSSFCSISINNGTEIIILPDTLITQAGKA